MVAISLQTIAERVGGECTVASDIDIHGIASVDQPRVGALVFVSQAKWLAQVADSVAAAVIIKPQWRDQVTMPAIVVDDPYAAYAQVSQLFAVRPAFDVAIHPAASIDPSAQIGAGVSIAAGVVIAADVRIGADCYIGPNVVLGEGSSIGAGTKIFANATIYHGVTIGQQCELASGVVIGADGFGFAPHAGQWTPIAQNGSVQIGDRVFIGANTTVDRGAINDTVIADGVIIDNQVQIAHNVIVGENTAIAGCAGIAGSAVIGRNCLIGGAAAITGHLSICDGVTVFAGSRITRSIHEPGEYASGTSFMKVKLWRKAVAKFARSVKTK